MGDDKMIERIRELIKEFNLTQAKFSEIIGLTTNGLQKILYGKNSASESTIRSICREFHVNREWLENGTGDMFVQPASDEDELETILTGQNDDIKEIFMLAHRVLSDEDWHNIRVIIDKFCNIHNPEDSG